VAALPEKLGNKVLSDLQQFVPTSEPQNWAQTDFSKRLKGSEKILEFRWPTSKGGTPRVLWFYDRQRVVVCTHGLIKKGDMPPEDVRHAEAVREAYMAARDGDELTVMPIEEFDPDD
jgi:phage-related protein